MTPRQHPCDPLVGDHILPLVAHPVPYAVADVRAHIVGEPHLSSLIYADAAGCSKPLAAGLSLLGRSSTILHTPLDVICGLQDKAVAVDAVFVSLQDNGSNISGLFEFVKDEHPLVRRIAFAEHNARNEGALLVDKCQHDMILWDPWDRVDFVEILKDALDCRVSRTRSSWSDLRLFEARGGLDTLAIAEIIRRYRYRIVRLAMDATHETTDTEDLVQDVYLSIVRDLPSFGGVCAPGAWIDRVACRSIGAYLHEKIRKVPEESIVRLNESPRGRMR